MAFEALLQPLQVVHAESGAASSLTTGAVTTTAGSLLIAIAGSFGNRFSGSVPITDNKGNTWQAAIAGTGVTQGFGGMWYAQNTNGGSGHTVTCTFTGSDAVNLTVIELPGMDTSSPLGSTATSTASATAHTTSSITANATVPEVFIGAYIGTGTTLQRVDSTFWAMAWRLQATFTFEGVCVCYRVVLPSTTDACTISASNEVGLMMLAGFKAAASTFSGGGGGGSLAWTPLTVLAGAGATLVRSVLSGAGPGRG